MTTGNHPAHSARPQSALVVDDDKLMLAAMGDMLRDLGIGRIYSAATGASALKAFDSAVMPPDVVVCDLNMPDGDGFQFMQQLAQRGYAGGVVLVSGMEQRFLNSASLMARFHQLDILGALAKPLQRADLGRTLAGRREGR